MAVRFTPAQRQAIDGNNRELLVSAAAGSGKTAVLVERIVRLIARDGYSIDRMLIVTFTRAAASEMRERLELRLSDAAESDARLRRQAELVSEAQISTIHSFCQQVVRQHFQYCMVDPQFMLMDERTRSALYQESMEEALDAIYERAKEDMELAALTRKFQEHTLTSMLDTVYGFLLSRPDPMEWLERQSEKTWTAETIDSEPMARDFCAEAKLMAGGALALWESAKRLAENPAFPPPYLNTLQSDRATLEGLAAACDAGLMALANELRKLKFVTLARYKATVAEEAKLAEAFKEARERYKKAADELKKLFPVDAAQGVNDMQAMAPATRGLAKGVRLLGEAFTRRKQEQGAIDFSDLEHMTLAVLREERLRQELSQRFDAVFVDEYQDVSELQEAILNGLKRAEGGGERRQMYFYVGDVKQSIYRFRQAEPGLFLRKLAAFSPKEDAPTRRIALNRNFRSKSAVLDAVNSVFQHVMDKRVNEIDYDEEARLYPGAPSVGDPPPELHVLNSEGLGTQEQVLAEAAWIGKDILRSIGKPVPDGNGEPGAPLRYRDIAILMPVSRGVADKVEQTLAGMGIPVYCENSGDALKSDEVTQVIQHLTLLDNLMNDVALIAELRSPLFELSERELAEIRLCKPERGASFLAALMRAAEEAGSAALRARCREALDTLERERFYARSMPMDEYLWDFLNRSGLYQHYGAQAGGRQRQANLRMLCDRAGEYEKNHTDGIRGFVDMLLMDAGGGEGSPTVVNPWEDVVRVMTIHKSKGLEFPTVYVMGLGRGMFGRSATKAISIHGAVGLGLQYVNEVARTKRATLMQGAIALRERNAERAERARVLYVALTRPKSRLVMVGSAKGMSAEAMRMRLAAGGADVYSVRAAHSMLDWLLQCVTPGDAIGDELSTSVLWETQNENELSTESTCFPHKNAQWQVVFHNGSLPSEKPKDVDGWNIPTPDVLADAPLLCVPPRDRQAASEAPRAPLKVGVTALCRAMADAAPLDGLDMEETPEQKRMPIVLAQPKRLSSLPSLPPFLAPPPQESGLKRGEMTHRLLELVELEGARAALDGDMAGFVRSQLEALVSRGVLAAEDAAYADARLVADFLCGEYGRRMLASPKVMREWRFNLHVHQPLETLVQGVIDLCFLENGAWVLVDFKTDRVASADALWERYGQQLAYYREALRSGTPYPVRESALYALRLGKACGRIDESIAAK